MYPFGICGRTLPQDRPDRFVRKVWQTPGFPCKTVYCRYIFCSCRTAPVHLLCCPFIRNLRDRGIQCANTVPYTRLYVETYCRSVCTHPARHQYCCRYYAGLRIPVPDGTFPKQYPCYGRPHRFLADQLFFKHTRAAPRALADMELLPCKADLGGQRSD